MRVELLGGLRIKHPDSEDWRERIERQGLKLRRAAYSWGRGRRADGARPPVKLSRYTRALLVYLAVERVVQREKLCAVFWSARGYRTSARNRLGQLLYDLQGRLGQRIIEEGRREEIEVVGLGVDVLDFERLVKQGDVEAAHRLYRGPFLGSLNPRISPGFELWADERRLYYRGLHRRATAAYVETLLEEGAPDRAVAVASEWAHSEPMDEGAQRTLIETLIQAGCPSRAREAYEAFAHRLRAAAGAEPTERTQEAVAAIL